jgi:catechol 2,3-dioxygenase-like lactoylglutathione lyase family enzyme
MEYNSSCLKGHDKMGKNSVLELRLVITTDDFENALRFYRDSVGMPELPAVAAPGARVAILDAGRATLELVDSRSAEFIDDVEVGFRVAGPVRVALEVENTAEMMARLVAAGAKTLGEPRATPFHSINARLEGAAGLQLTLFQRVSES